MYTVYYIYILYYNIHTPVRTSVLPFSQSLSTNTLLPAPTLQKRPISPLLTIFVHTKINSLQDFDIPQDPLCLDANADLRFAHRVCRRTKLSGEELHPGGTEVSEGFFDEGAWFFDSQVCMQPCKRKRGSRKGAWRDRVCQKKRKHSAGKEAGFRKPEPKSSMS